MDVTVKHQMWIISSIYSKEKVQHTHQTTEGDCWRQAGKVDEEESCNALNVKSIFKVSQIMRKSTFHIVDQAAEQSSCPFERISIWISFLQ